MQNITKKLQDILKAEGGFNADADFRALRDFYLEMIKSGVATKQEYSLPHLDTVGHFFYNNVSSSFQVNSELELK